MAKIHLKGLVFDPDRHGKDRYYVRVRGHKKYRMREAAGSEAFFSEYHAVMRDMGAAKEPTRVKRYSLDWLVNQYFVSPAFQIEYKEATRRQQRNILTRICAEHGDKDTRGITSKVVRAGRDARASKPGAANNYLKTLKALFAWAVEQEILEVNPVIGVKRLKPKSASGFHTWTVDECLAYEAYHALGTTARLSYALMLYAGARRSDVVKLGRQHITADGWIAWDQTKTDKRIEMPILPALKEAIDAHPVTGLHFIVTAYGKPFSADGFGSKMKQWTQEAGLPGRCASHGLRKALAARLAEGGATDEQIASILGHSDTRSTKTYTRSADQKRLAEAAMRTIEGQSVPLGETLSRHVRQNGDKSQ